MIHRVHFTEAAEQDLFDIWRYVANHDSAANAEALLDALEETCQSLSHSPGKGHIPPELERICIDLYREIHFKPYRILYEVRERDVVVYAVLDSRRDLQSLLERRLVR